MNVSNNQTGFNPISITITIDTPEELRAFRHLTKYYQTVTKALCLSPVDNNYVIDLLNALYQAVDPK
jgi:hypothetical protein